MASKARQAASRLYNGLQGVKAMLMKKEGFGMYEILGIAAVLIVASFVLIPGFKNFAKSLIEALSKWFEDTIQSQLFPSS